MTQIHIGVTGEVQGVGLVLSLLSCVYAAFMKNKDIIDVECQ